MQSVRKHCKSNCPPHDPSRKGAIVVIATVAIVLLICLAVLSVDVSFMQLTRTELQVAADSAAKAGSEALMRTQDPVAAKQAAIDVAALNRVAGRPLILTDADIQLGAATQQTDGSWEFTEGVQPYNAVRVDALMSDDNDNGSVPFFLAGFLGQESFTPRQTATSANMEQDVVLAIDRSHSMCFDMTAVDWSYPAGTPMTPHPICYPPHPTESRWGALRSSLNEYLDITEESSPQPQVGLVTWGSEIGTNTAEYYYTGKTEVAVANEVGISSSSNWLAQLLAFLRSRSTGGGANSGGSTGSTVSGIAGNKGIAGNTEAVRAGINARSANVMLGGTHMSAGMDAAITSLQNGRPLARKTMILMTDGQWNYGEDPHIAAERAKALGIVIHTVTFLPGADQTTMIEVAEITGGHHYHASNAAELTAVFEELARTLPVVLTD